MLRKRSRAVTSKQAKIGEQNNNLEWLPCERQTKPISYFFNSPRIFKGFLTIGSPPPPPPPPLQPPQPPPPQPPSSEVEATTMSPTSILDGKHFSILPNLWIDNKIPNSSTKTMSQNKHSWDQLTNKKGIGLALIDENIDQQQQQQQQQQPHMSNFCLKQKRKLVVFGSQLKIQVPPLPSSSVFPCFSPESPREFGIKTPRSLLRTFSGIDSAQVHIVGDCEVGKEAENISVSEMEDSEDYTCVISHGPNPKTTHIFGNCIVGSCCGIDRSSSLSSSRRNGCPSPLGDSAPSQVSFLSYCHHCKKKLGQGNDIFIYRGEKAFCSQECRCQEMLYDDGVES